MTLPTGNVRLLIVHGDIYGFGGAEIVALRTLRTLQQHYRDITLVHTGGPLDTARIESRCGLRIDQTRVRFLTAPLADTLMPPFLGNWALIKYAVALRYASRIAADYSAVITTYGECTFPHPRVVQYIHYPQFLTDRESLAHLGASYASAIKLGLRQTYVRVAQKIAGWHPNKVRHHIAITNSHWTGAQFRRNYGECSYRVIYPGAEITSDRSAFVAFENRANDFVMLGRIVAGKRIETGIEIVRLLRDERGHKVGLDLIGNAPSSYRSILGRQLRRDPWVRWHPNLSRQEMERLVSTKKWGLHCCEFEHYGIAPAEMQQLGCIVFVPDSGGQREIVTNDGLRYSSVAEAVDKIDAALRTPGAHGKLLAQIAESNELHQSRTFETSFLEVVNELTHD